MKKSLRIFLWCLVIFQILTALIHSISFFSSAVPANETEMQLKDLMENYRLDAGMGFHPSTADLFLALSTCFTFICLLGGISNWFFIKKKLQPGQWRGWLLIQCIIFGSVFLVMLNYTFVYPVALTGLIFLFAVLGFLSARRTGAIKVSS